MVPVASRMKKKKGRSAVNGIGVSKLIVADKYISIAVAAAASVPSSSTWMVAW